MSSDSEYCYERHTYEATPDLHDQEPEVLEVLSERNPPRIRNKHLTSPRSTSNIFSMKSLLLLLLVGISLATSACTVSYDRGYGYTSYSGSYYPTRPYYNRCEPRDVYIAGPQYYRTNIPYFRNNMRNYTGTPIIAPNACNPTTNVIIPNSWN